MTNKASLETRIVSAKASRRAWLKHLPLREHFVDRGSLVAGRRAVAAALRTGRERELQAAIEKHPRLLARELACGLGWVIPQKRLGSEFVTDFLVGEQLSPGFFWLAVELESPLVPMFTRAGDPSRYLVHAIRQIQEWRAWLEANQSYASRAREQQCLGLADISPRLPGLVLIGRRCATNSTTNALRRQMMADSCIEIRSYDSLLDKPHAMPLYARFNDRAMR